MVENQDIPFLMLLWAYLRRIKIYSFSVKRLSLDSMSRLLLHTTLDIIIIFLEQIRSLMTQNGVVRGNAVRLNDQNENIALAITFQKLCFKQKNIAQFTKDGRIPKGNLFTRYIQKIDGFYCISIGLVWNKNVVC